MRKIPIQVEVKTEEEAQILLRIVKRDGTLRATKPMVDTEDDITMFAAFVWRQLVFVLSEEPRHHCMPVVSYFELPGTTEERKAHVERLHAFVDRIIAPFPPSECKGLIRWGGLL